MEQIIQQTALELAKIITEKAIRGGLTDIDALASVVGILLMLGAIKF